MMLLFIAIVTLIDTCLPASYNQPKFSPCASWNDTAVTFSTNSTNGNTPLGIFVDTNNTVYLAGRLSDRVLVWNVGDPVPIRTLTNRLNNPLAVFATTNGDLYIANSMPDQVYRFRFNITGVEIMMNISSNCVGLFLDLNDTIYCALGPDHVVVKRSLRSNGTSPFVIAGNGSNGTGPLMLNRPTGIFVDEQSNLYVADRNNHRIQRFAFGESNGTTVVGSGMTGTISLNQPTGIVLDADHYIFIVDSNNDRIVGSGSYGFRCLVGCHGSGSASDQLSNPYMFNFDSYGNMFVVDRGNNRIQKFLLSRNYCDSALSTALLTTMEMDERTSTKKFSLEKTSKESTFLSIMATTVSTQSTKHDEPTTSTTVYIEIQSSTLSSRTTATDSIIIPPIQPVHRKDTTSMDLLDEKTSTSVNLKDSTFSLSVSTQSTKHDDTTAVLITSHATTIGSVLLSTRTNTINTDAHSTRSTQSVNTTKEKTITTKTYETTHSVPNPRPSSQFVPPVCNDTDRIGATCNTSSAPCNVLKPCRNGATCISNKSVSNGYQCQCLWGFNGSKCELDVRPCKINTCWNNGTCVNISNSAFSCVCPEGWTDIHCETRVNYCQNITCQNNGVCRPLFRGYQCECSSKDYSGRYCEIIATALVTRKFVAKSFSYVAIICILVVIGFIVTLDILKYVFHIDPSGTERKRMARMRFRRKKRRQKPVVAIRFRYVNRVQSISTVEGTIQ